MVLEVQIDSSVHANNLDGWEHWTLEANNL